MVKILLKLMQSIYLIYIIEDNYNIVRDRFETDLVHAMKRRPLFVKEQRKFQNILACFSITEKYKNCH